jgi:hypothetical protein
MSNPSPQPGSPPRVRSRTMGLTLVLSLFWIAAMAGGAYYLVQEQDRKLEQAAREKAVMTPRGFALAGAGAMQENLFKTQEALTRSLASSLFVEFDLIDADNMIVASQTKERIGTESDLNLLLPVENRKQEVVLPVRGPLGKPALLVVEPLFDQAAVVGWLRAAYPLEPMERARRQYVQDLAIVMGSITGLGLLLILLAVRGTRKRVATAWQNFVATGETGMASGVWSTLTGKFKKPRS